MYENPSELATILSNGISIEPVTIHVEPNRAQPIYPLEVPDRTNWAVRLTSRLKKA